MHNNNNNDETVDGWHAAGNAWARNLMESASKADALDADTQALVDHPDRLHAAAGRVAEQLSVQWFPTEDHPYHLLTTNFVNRLVAPESVPGDQGSDKDLSDAKEWLVLLHRTMSADWQAISRLASDFLANELPGPGVPGGLNRPQMDGIEGDEDTRLDNLARERGYLVEEMEVELGDGRTRPGWLVYDLGWGQYVQDAVNWTTASQVEEFILGSS